MPERRTLTHKARTAPVILLMILMAACIVGAVVLPLWVGGAYSIFAVAVGLAAYAAREHVRLALIIGILVIGAIAIDATGAGEVWLVDQDAGITPTSVPKVIPGHEVTLTVTRPYRRKYISLTVVPRQVPTMSPTCTRNLSFDATTTVPSSRTVSVRSDGTADVEIDGALPPFLIRLSVNGNESCTVDIYVLGKLHNFKT